MLLLIDYVGKISGGSLNSVRVDALYSAWYLKVYQSFHCVFVSEIYLGTHFAASNRARDFVFIEQLLSAPKLIYHHQAGKRTG